MTLGRAVSVVLLVVGLLTACSGRVAEDDVRAAADDVDIGLTDFDIVASSTVLSDGDVAFDITNAGATAHDLRVIDGSSPGTGILAPGETATLDLDTTGWESVILYCSLPGHRDQGMEITLDVRR